MAGIDHLRVGLEGAPMPGHHLGAVIHPHLVLRDQDLDPIPDEFVGHAVPHGRKGHERVVRNDADDPLLPGGQGVLGQGP
ncbi:hypothetical protein D3C86_1888970 [compost metagenome]